MFAPDLMHEVELGVWKGTFAHLLRLVQAQGPGSIQEFNARCVLPVNNLKVPFLISALQYAPNADIRSRQDPTICLRRCKS